MSRTRLVVACRMPGALTESERPVEALGRLEALATRALDLGGELTASTYDGVAFSWPEDALASAIELATTACHARTPNAPTWAAGVALGELHEPTRDALGRPNIFPWGAPLASAWALARLARPREVLVDVSVPAVVSRELLVNRARVGRVGGARVRGFRLDARQPWRALASRDVRRMVEPTLIGRSEQLAYIMAANGLVVLRADSGTGGSRLLSEVAAATRPSRSITLAPLSVIHEPLGALRRAMAFVAATERITMPAEMHAELDRLLGAQGVTVEKAALLIAHQLQRQAGEPPASLLIDDASDVDAPSLEACSRAMAILGSTLRVVARIDSMSQLPQTLARHPHSETVTLDRLASVDGQALAGACTGDALEAHARVQWARRGGNIPMGVVEAVAAGIAKGELLWSERGLSPLKRVAGDEIARPVGYWIAKRAEDLEPASRDVLTALAHLGGEASAPELAEVVHAMSPSANLEAIIKALFISRWIREPRPGSFALLSRAHREAVLELSRDTHTREWRSAVARTLERSPGTLRRAEAAQHAARCGDGPWAARLAVSAGRTAAGCGLEEVAVALTAFAGVQDPLFDETAPDSSDDTTVAATKGDSPRAAPVVPTSTGAAPFPLVSAKPKLKAPPPPVPSAAAAAVARPPAVASSPAVVAPAPVASSGPPPLPARARLSSALPAVTQATLLASLAELRETRWSAIAQKALVDGADVRKRSRGLLAMARAFAAEGRSEEALVHAIDALARAREGSEPDGVRACLLFIAHMFEQTRRAPEAGRIREAAEAVV